MYTITNNLNILAFMVAPVFYKLLYMSITAIIIGGIILVIRKLLDKKIPPIWKYFMWILVIFALIIPFRPQSKISLTENIQQIENISFREEYNSISKLAPKENLSQQKILEFNKYRNDILLKSFLFDVAIPLTWFFGMISAFVILIASKVYLSYKIKHHSLSHNQFNEIFLNCKAKLNVNGNIQIITQDYIKSPSLIGLIKPKILLPQYTSTMSEENLSYILFHELAHFKRKDMLINYILLTLQAIHWFNPLIWLIFKLIREDMELLNDSYVLNHIGNENSKNYARSLVETLGLSHNVSIIPKLICMVDNKKNVARRISMIKLGETFKKHKIILAVCCLAIIFVVSGLFLTQKGPVSTGVATNAEILEIDKENDTITVKEIGTTNLLGSNCILSINKNTNFTTLDSNENLVILTIDDFSVGDYVVVFANDIQETFPTKGKLQSLQLSTDTSLLVSKKLNSITLEKYPHSSLYAIDKFAQYISTLSSESANMILNDEQLIYSMLMDSYWKNKIAIKFPSYDQRTEHNKEIFDITPFLLNLELPTGWKVNIKSDTDKKYPLIGAWT
ncbi:MAG: M56 family metallopeptidase, partial [Oscillospiraceae bacterium]